LLLFFVAWIVYDAAWTLLARHKLTAALVFLMLVTAAAADCTS
jgi:hypothetical protein